MTAMWSSAELIERHPGLTTRDIARWSSDQVSILHPVEGGGSGFPYQFDDTDALCVAAFMAWRSAVAGGGVHVLIAQAVHDQYPDGPPLEAAATLTITVPLTHGVTLLLELEP